jgi:hypothetical protein
MLFACFYLLTSLQDVMSTDQLIQLSAQKKTPKKRKLKPHSEN